MYKKDWAVCLEQYHKFKKLEDGLNSLFREILKDYGPSGFDSDTNLARTDIKGLSEFEDYLKKRLAEAIIKDKEFIIGGMTT